MNLFESIERRGHEQVVICSDKASGLRAIIGIHSTALGPSLGGVRMWHYQSDEDALNDVLRLSRAMTYKAAVAGFNLGGGKSVILADPHRDKTEALLRTFGRYVDSLGGRYIAAEDLGTNEEDMRFIRMETRFVTGTSSILGGSGDPSPVTALGVYVGMKASAHHVFGSDSLAGRTIVVQGAGHVGSHVIRHARKENARVFVADINDANVNAICKETGAEKITIRDVVRKDCDIFCPAAFGAILNDETIPQLKCKIVAGAANNQLSEEKKHATMLDQRGILYAPDYVINAGGLISVCNEWLGVPQMQSLKQAENIYAILLRVFELAREQHIPTIVASNNLAEERIAKLPAGLHGIYIPTRRGYSHARA